MLTTTLLISLLPFLALSTAAPAPSRIGKRYTGVLIQAQRGGECITPDAAFVAEIVDGTPVVSKSCDQALTWDVNYGSGSIAVHDATNFALDIGLTPGNNGGLKVWTSYPTAPQQTWFLTGDNRIAITGGDQCLDEGDNGVQTYQCTTGNTNQIFVPVDQATSTSSSGSASPTASPTSYPDDPCYGSGGSYSTYTSDGTVTSTLVIPTPSCMPH